MGDADTAKGGDRGAAPSPLCGLEESRRELAVCCGIAGSEAEHADDAHRDRADDLDRAQAPAREPETGRANRTFGRESPIGMARARSKFDEAIRAEKILSKARELAIGNASLTSNAYSLWWRPPEVLMGTQRYDFSADVWVAGCVCLGVCEGRPAFPGMSE